MSIFMNVSVETGAHSKIKYALSIRDGLIQHSLDLILVKISNFTDTNLPQEVAVDEKLLRC